MMQPNTWGTIHKAHHVSNKMFGHIHTNPTNIHSAVGNKAIVYNEYKYEPLSSLSEAGVRFPAQLQVGKLVVAGRWLAVYSTEP